jgi:hypothetical protein
VPDGLVLGDMVEPLLSREVGEPVSLGLVVLGEVVLGDVVLGLVVLGLVVLGEVVLGDVVLGLVSLGAVVLGDVVLGDVVLGEVVLGDVVLGDVPLSLGLVVDGLVVDGLPGVVELLPVPVPGLVLVDCAYTMPPATAIPTIAPMAVERNLLMSYSCGQIEETNLAHQAWRTVFQQATCPWNYGCIKSIAKYLPCGLRRARCCRLRRVLPIRAHSAHSSRSRCSTRHRDRRRGNRNARTSVQVCRWHIRSCRT